MKKFVLIVFLMALVPNIAMAKRVRGLFGKSERIEKIMDVDIKGSNGEDLYLGYKTTSQFFFMGVYIKDDGYVLGIKGKFGSYYPLDNQQLLSFQENGSLPNPLPSYEIPFTDWLWGFSLWILMVILAVIWFFPKSGKSLFERGCTYYFGKNVKVDYSKAFTYFQKSAKKNYAPAIFNLGIMHLKGQGVPKDTQKAVPLFEQASDIGNNNANVTLGNLYYEGVEIPKDLDKAKVWFNKACGQGHDGACKMVAHIQEQH